MNGKTMKIFRKYLRHCPKYRRKTMKELKRDWKAMDHHQRGGCRAGMIELIVSTSLAG